MKVEEMRERAAKEFVAVIILCIVSGVLSVVCAYSNMGFAAAFFGWWCGAEFVIAGILSGFVVRLKQ